MSKGWGFRAPPPSRRKKRRPNWLALRESGEPAVVGRQALATEMDRRAGLDPPDSWQEVVDLGFGGGSGVRSLSRILASGSEV